MTGRLPVPRPLTASDIPQIVPWLSDAFLSDPGYSHVFPNRRREALVFLHERLLAMRLEGGATMSVLDHERQPVAFVSCAPDTLSFGLTTYLRHGLVRMPFHFGVGAVRRMLASDQEAGSFRRAHVPREPHVWFSQLGVHPDHRGRGHVRRLVEPLLARCDTDGSPAATMTTVPDLLPFYERLGFQTRGEHRAQAGFRMWVLVRPSRTPSGQG